MLTNAIPAGSSVRAKGRVWCVTRSGVERFYESGTVFEVVESVAGDTHLTCKCPRLGLPVVIPSDAVESVCQSDDGAADSEGGEAD